jgi:hypothetical protein
MDVNFPAFLSAPPPQVFNTEDADTRLGVESEDGRLIASHQQERRHVPRQRLQPRHVQRRRHDALAGHWQRPATKMQFTMKKLTEAKNLLTFFIVEWLCVKISLIGINWQIFQKYRGQYCDLVGKT